MDSIIVNESVLENYLQELISNSGDKYADDLKNGFFNAFQFIAQERQFGNLNLDTNAWEIHLLKPSFKHLAAHAMASAMLLHFSYSELPVTVLAVILMSIFEKENIKIEGTNEEIYLALTVNGACRDFRTTEEWYNYLPTEVQERTHILDFEEILNKLVYAGLAASQNGTFLIHDFGSKKWRIHVI